MRARHAITRFLPAWIVAAIAAGLLTGDVGLSWLTTPVLVVMVGSICLTLPLRSFRSVRPMLLALLVVLHAAMGLVAYAAAWLAGLSAEATAGFVILGSMVPELVSPTMTKVADGDLVLSSTLLVVAGVLSLGLAPAYVAWLVDPSVRVALAPLAFEILVAVVLPMLAAVALRSWKPRLVARGDAAYPEVSAAMVVLVMFLVAAENAEFLLGRLDLLPAMLAAAVLLNAVGYAVGWVAAVRSGRDAARAGFFGLGTRDFAVAGAIALATGLPPEAALAALVFGGVEMVTAALAAGYFGRASNAASQA